jgi:8-oxo-dGTP pyrophosphatase MutT (NUDIX family)
MNEVDSTLPAPADAAPAQPVPAQPAPTAPSTPGLFDVVDSEVMFEGKMVSLRVDRVVMPGGGVAAREVMKHHRAVAVVAVDEESRVILVSQYRHPLRRRLWELPAGLLDIEGEDPQPAAARELGEEVGVRADRWDVLVDAAPSPGISDEAVRIYLARELTEIGRQGEVSDEEADLTIVRVPLAVAVDAVLRGDIVNGPAVSGLLAAQLALEDDRALRTAGEAWIRSPALVRDDDEELAQPPAVHA